MKKLGLLGLTTVLAASSAFGVTAAKTEANSIEKSITKNSMANRVNKKFNINVVTGIGYSATLSGIEAGYYLNPNTIIKLRGISLKSVGAEEDSIWAETEEAKKLWERDGKGSAVELNVKHFTSNSFYVDGGIYSRSQSHVNEAYYSVNYFYGGDTVRELIGSNEGKINDIGANFKIGNQWQYDNFTIGCDWFGLTRSLSGTKEGTIEDRDLNTFSLLNFYLGASF